MYSNRISGNSTTIFFFASLLIELLERFRRFQMLADAFGSVQTGFSVITCSGAFRRVSRFSEGSVHCLRFFSLKVSCVCRRLEFPNELIRPLVLHHVRYLCYHHAKVIHHWLDAWDELLKPKGPQAKIGHLTGTHLKFRLQFKFKLRFDISIEMGHHL